MVAVNGTAQSPHARAETGKALRDRLPRASHAKLRLPPHRDPLAILRRTDEDRIPELIPIRYGRMLQSPFAFFRGAAAIMAADLSHTPAIGVNVQACGDCHLKNFGGFATPERNIVFDINDFDETLAAPWEWDVKRLAASFYLAAGENGLADDVAHAVAETCARAYRKAMRDFSELDPLALWYQKFDADEFVRTLPRSERARVARRIAKVSSTRGSDIDYPKLTEVVEGHVRIHDAPPLIFHPEPAREPDFVPAVEKILSEYRETLAEDRRLLFDNYRFVDAAIKVVGVGSVGTRCWVALLMSRSNDPLFLQFKQAKASVLEPYAGKGFHSHHGQRIVTGQRLMQAASDIFLGWTTGPGGDYYVRQLRDAKISPNLEIFDAPMFDVYAKACGWNLARAHAKSGGAQTIAAYLGKGDEFDAAIATFGQLYAERTERDHAALRAAVKAGKVEIFTE